MLCLACAEEASSRGKHSSTFEVLRIDLLTGENTDNSKYKEHRAQEEKKSPTREKSRKCYRVLIKKEIILRESIEPGYVLNGWAAVPVCFPDAVIKH